MGLKAFHSSMVNNGFSVETKIIEGKWVVTQRNNWSFAVEGTALKTSIDNSVTFSNTIVFNEAPLIRSAQIYPNGNIMFQTRENKVYLTNVNLSSLVEKTIMDIDGVTPYNIHTPVDTDHPGWYFEIIIHEAQHERPLQLFTNYGNAYTSGAQPTNVYGTYDNGETIKVMYKFGQNPRYTDTGGTQGGTGGTLLGDASNPVICRHAHTIEFHEAENAYYMHVGDDYYSTAPVIEENNWLKLQEDTVNKVLVPVSGDGVIDFGFPIPTTHRLKSAGMFFNDGFVYWGSDNQNAVDSSQNGVWRAPTANLRDPTTHEQIIPILDDFSSSINDIKVDHQTKKIIAVVNYAFNINGGTRRRLLLANDYGLGERKFYFNTDADFMRIKEKNNQGYYLIDFEGREPAQTKSFFIKF